MGSGLLWLWRSLITLLWYHLGPAWTAPILMWEGMRWLHFSNKVILSLPVGRQRKNGSLQVPGKHTRWKWTFLHQSTLWWCAAEEQCHAQQSWGGISWVVLQRSMPIRLGRAAQSPGVPRTLVIPSLSVHPAVPLTHIYGGPVCVVSSAYRGGDQARVWMEGERRTGLCREFRLRGLWELKYSCFKNEWAITSVPDAETSSTRCLEWHIRLGHRHEGCLVEGVYMHCEWVEWWVEDGEISILHDFLTVNSGREMGAAARSWLRLEKESSCRYLMTSTESESLHTLKKRRPSSLTLMENST